MIICQDILKQTGRAETLTDWKRGEEVYEYYAYIRALPD